MTRHVDDGPSHDSVGRIEPTVDTPSNIVVLSTDPVTQGHRLLCRELLAPTSVDDRTVRAFRLAPAEETWLGGPDSDIEGVETVVAPIDDMTSAEFERLLYGDVKQSTRDATSPILFFDHVQALERRFGTEDSKRILDTITELVRNMGHIAYYRSPRRTRTEGVPEHLSGIFDYAASPNLELTGWRVDALE